MAGEYSIRPHNHLGEGDGGEINQIADPYSDEKARDALAAALTEGTDITITVDDENDTITISSTASSSQPWSEDANSPFTSSGAASHTYTLAGSYDVVLVFFEHLQNDHGSAQDLALQVNGQTGSSYTFRSSDGTTASTARFQLVSSAASGEGVSGTLEIAGNADNADALNVAGPLAGSSRASLLHGECTAVSSGDLTQFTVLGTSGNVSVDARVYGWSA